MKIILSHDVDHLFWSEHYLKDTFIFGRLYRNFRGLIKGSLNLRMFASRSIIWGRLNRLEELLEFYEIRKIKASFFIGMSNGQSLSYNYKKSVFYINLLKSKGHFIGLHGIEVRNRKKMRREVERFLELNKLTPIGYRSHYLNWSGFTYSLLGELRFRFSSSQMSLSKPYRIGTIWEFPVSVMDSSLIHDFQNTKDLEEIIAKTRKKIDLAKSLEIPYFVINFHDIYFDDQFKILKSWFEDTVDYLRSENYDFVSFEQAIEELEYITK